MGRPSKFTAERRRRILEAKRVGASNRTAARLAGISPSVLQDWLKRGETGPKDSAYAKFFAEFEEAAAHPRERALGIIYDALPDRPDLAWKYVERREEGYAPPIAAPAAVGAGPVNIVLSFTETSMPRQSEVIVDSSADRPAARVAELPAATASRSTRGRKKR